MTLESRVLFTSIPKCGKNIVYSFLGALGFTPLPVNAATGAASYVSSAEGMPAKASHAYPAPGSEARADDAASAVAAALITGPVGSVVHGHLAYDPSIAEAARSRGAPIVFVYRDPADMVLSAAQYVRHRHLPDHLWDWYGHLDLDDLIAVLTVGDERLLSVAELYQAFAGWRDQPDVLSLRFEDMVGSRGGGSADTQRAVLEVLAGHVGWRGSDAELTSAIDVAFNPRAGTFFRGQIGTAARDFAPGVRAAFAEHAGAVQEAWGYRPLGPADQASSEETIALLRSEVDRAWSTLRSTVARLRAEHDMREGIAYAESAARQSDVQALLTRLSAAEAESEQRRLSLEDLHRQLVTVEAESGTRASNLIELQERLAAADAQRHQLRVQVDGLKRRLAAVDAENTTRGANLVEIQERLLSLQAESAARQASLVEAQKRLASVEAERASLRGQVEALQARRGRIGAAGVARLLKTRARPHEPGAPEPGKKQQHSRSDALSVDGARHADPGSEPSNGDARDRRRPSGQRDDGAHDGS